jgi:hypothetical protein
MTATSGSINSSRANDRKGFGSNSDAQPKTVTCHGRERDGARGLARYDCEKRIMSTHMNKLTYCYLPPRRRQRQPAVSRPLDVEARHPAGASMDRRMVLRS